MAAASASTAPPPGEMPTPGPPPPPADALLSAARPRPRSRVREVTSRYLSAPLPTQAPRLSTSSHHSASVPPPPRAQQHHHHRGTPAPALAAAPAPFVFGLAADENRPPPTPGSRKRGSAPDLFDAMHRPRPGPGLNPPATPLAPGASRAAATPTTSRRSVLRPSRASDNETTPALQDRRSGCARPSTPARASFSSRSASPETPRALSSASINFCAPASCLRRAPCSEVRSSLQVSLGTGRPQDPFCFRALNSALSDCQPTVPQALVKPPQPPGKVVVVKKGALMGGDKAAGKQEDMHQLRIMDSCYMQYRFLNARGEAVAVAKSTAAEESLYGSSERIVDLQESVAEKRSELECLKRVERVHSVVGSQVPFLEKWNEVETEHLSCLGRGTAALRYASSRLPTTGKIRTNIGGVNESLQSAMKIFEELSHSVEHFSGKVEEVEGVASELAEVMGTEQLLLEECADLLHQAHSMKVMEDSLRTQLLHLKNQAKNET